MLVRGGKEANVSYPEFSSVQLMKYPPDTGSLERTLVLHPNESFANQPSRHF